MSRNPNKAAVHKKDDDAGRLTNEDEMDGQSTEETQVATVPTIVADNENEPYDIKYDTIYTT
jgi:hypothetical protein